MSLKPYMDTDRHDGNTITFLGVKPWLQKTVSCPLDVRLLAPGPLPNEDGGLGPNPGAHSNTRPKHGEKVDFLHHQTGPVLNGAFRDWLVGLRGDCHVGFTPVEHTTEMISLPLDHATLASHIFWQYD